MKTVQTTRLDNSIIVYRDRIIVPRKVLTTYSEENGASKTDVSFTASAFDDDDETRDEGLVLEIGEFKSLEGAIRIAKLTIDLDIERYLEWIG